MSNVPEPSEIQQYIGYSELYHENTSTVYPIINEE